MFLFLMSNSVIPPHISYSYFILMSARPEGNALPDDQGKLGFCTRYALGKGIANGFMDKDFVLDREIDFEQNAITFILVNEERVKR